MITNCTRRSLCGSVVGRGFNSHHLHQIINFLFLYKKYPTSSRKLLNFYGPVLTQVGVLLNIPGFLEGKNRSSIHAIFRVELPYPKLVGSKNSVYTHFAGFLTYLFIFMILLYHIFLNFATLNSKIRCF